MKATLKMVVTLQKEGKSNALFSNRTTKNNPLRHSTVFIFLDSESVGSSKLFKTLCVVK
jgi:hypothetical protein